MSFDNALTLSMLGLQNQNDHGLCLHLPNALQCPCAYARLSLNVVAKSVIQVWKALLVRYFAWTLHTLHRMAVCMKLLGTFDAHCQEDIMRHPASQESAMQALRRPAYPASSWTHSHSPFARHSRCLSHQTCARDGAAQQQQVQASFPYAQSPQQRHVFQLMLHDTRGAFSTPIKFSHPYAF